MVNELNPESVITCGCYREFTVGDVVTLAEPHLLKPSVLTSNPDGHQVEWRDALGDPSAVCGWLVLYHGRGHQAAPTPAHFVRLPHPVTTSSAQ